MKFKNISIYKKMIGCLMKKIIIACVVFSSTSAFAETVKIGIYSQVGSVTEFCLVNSGFVFVNGMRIASNVNLGKIFELNVPKTAKLVIRDASIGRGKNECNSLVIEKEDGSEIKSQQIAGTINFEVQL